MTGYAVGRLKRLSTQWRLQAGSFVPVWAASVMLSAFLAGCQMDGAPLPKNAGNDDIKMPSTVVNETYGGENGPELTLFLRKGASGLYEGASREVRDGASLGIGELGNSQLKLRVMDIGAGQAAIAAEVAAAKARGAVMIVSYLPPAETAAIAAIPPTQRPLLLNLGSPTPTTPGDVFNLVSDEFDSAAEGVRAAVASGHKKIALLAETNVPQPFMARLGIAISTSGGTFMGSGYYGATDAPADIQAKNRLLIQASEAVVVLGGTAEVGMVATAVRGVAVPNQMLVGTNAWPQSSYATPAANGVVIALIDPEGSGLIAERYQRHYKHPLTIASAYGYDAMAIASGLVRSQGPQALTAANLMSSVGFRGTTGLFRFTATGMVERKMVIHTIEGGKLKATLPASRSF